MGPAPRGRPRPDTQRAYHYDAYLAALDSKGFDAVYIAVPNAFHREYAVPALERGLHVLLEKPMATTIEDCDRLIAAAAAHDRILTIGHELRLSTQWGTVKALIDAGAVGEPMYALVSLFRFPYRPGTGGWRYARDRVGSWILEEPVHFFDFLMWYFERAGDPVSVLAVGNAAVAEIDLPAEADSVGPAAEIVLPPGADQLGIAKHDLSRLGEVFGYWRKKHALGRWFHRG